MTIFLQACPVKLNCYQTESDTDASNDGGELLGRVKVKDRVWAICAESPDQRKA